MPYTTDSMRSFLETAKPGTLQRAILSLYALQTADEQGNQTTRHRNNRGFSQRTVKKGTYIAQWLLGQHRGPKGSVVDGRRRLSGGFVRQAREIASHHARQLADIANDGDLSRIRDNQFRAWGMPF